VGAEGVTHRRVFAIAAPTMVANLTTPLLGVVGTAVIGSLGQAHLLGAVAMSALVFDLIFWIFGFLRMGTVALTAQALGARDETEQRAVFVRALMIAGAIGVALLVVQAPLARIVYDLMGGSEAVTAAAKTYFFVRIWSAPFALGNYVVLGWLVGLGRAGRALALQIAINLLNMVVTAALVLGFDFGVTGAALGAVAAEAAGFVGSLALVRHLGGTLTLPAATIFDRTRLVRLFAINRDIMIRTAALITAFFFFTAQGARAGDTLLAANAVLHNFTLIGSFFLDGFATAAEQLCGRAVGARDRSAFARSVHLIIGWGFGFGLATTAIFLVAGTWLIDLMTASPEVQVAARQFMLFAALAPAAGVLAYAYDGIFIGATWARDMRNLMVLALLIFLAAWLALRSFGNAGLWAAFLVHYAARGGLEALRYPALLRKSFGS
jgi:multidrug resistance protein, MATE family